MQKWWVLGSTFLLATGSIVACGMSADSAFAGRGGDSSDAGASEPGPGLGSSSSSSGASGTGGAAPSPDGVLLVHAASTSSFRLCFENMPDAQPQPDSTVMPAANIVGVEIGSAVRINPLAPQAGKTPGKVTLYPVALIKSLYPGQKAGPSCSDLAANLGDVAKTDVGTIDDDLSHGLHVLAVTGCPAQGGQTNYTKEQCGPDYTGTANVKITHVPVVSTVTSGGFRAQVVNLSRTAESARGTASLDVTFAAKADDASDAGDAGAKTPVAKGVQYLKAPTEPVAVEVTSNDDAYYDSAGFTVTAGPKALFSQSLASIQKLSAPDDVPSNYFAFASSYLLLLVGDIANGTPADDPLRKLHFLAMPVVDPSADAGSPTPPPSGDAGSQ